MQNPETGFWARYEDEYIRPIDVAVRRVSPSEAVGFVRGTRSIFNLVEALDPDVIFLPERGAGPIEWALERFRELHRGKDRPKVYLPIGTCVDPLTSKIWGPDKLVKRETTQKSVDDLRKTKGWLEKPLLIDEVQSGSTLTNVVHNLVRATMVLDSEGEGIPVADKLYVIAAQDTRNSWLIHKKAKGYKTIVNNVRSYIQAFIVEMPLFTADRQIFLNYLLGGSGNVSSKQLRIPMVLQNVEAQNFVKGLVDIVTKPLGIGKSLGNLLQRDEFYGKELPDCADRESIIRWYKEVAKTASST